MRQVVLDTETTGLNPEEGHRVIEIGCVELVDRRLTERRFHVYINPGREVDHEAVGIHGLTNEFLADKPNFSGIADEFVDFIRGAELVAHNANFDIGFLEAELERIPNVPGMTELMLGGAPLDTLALAREKRPGKRNSLDALCREYKIDASERQLHGALLDAELLTLVYLAMTREQSRMFGGFEPDIEGSRFEKIKKLTELGRSPHIIEPSDKERQNHKLFLDELRKSGDIFWDKASS